VSWRTALITPVGTPSSTATTMDSTASSTVTGTRGAITSQAGWS
jgi:hypothetical protein